MVTIAGMMAIWDCGSKPPVNPTPTLSSVSLASSSVVGGNAVSGTATLSSAAPSGGVTITLGSSNATVANVPGTATVTAGATSGTFSVSTTAVGSSTPIVITATFSGTSRTANLTVTPPNVPIANFTVASNVAVTLANGTTLPIGTADACPLVPNSGNPILECTFDGSSSTGTSLNQWAWTYSFGTQSRSETTPGNSLKPTASGCGFFAGQSSTSNGGITFLQMTVDLRVRDSAGQQSVVKSNQNVRIFPQKLCGYAF